MVVVAELVSLGNILLRVKELLLADVVVSDIYQYPNVVVVPNGESPNLPLAPIVNLAPYKPRPREQVPNGVPGVIGKTHR